MKYTKYKCTNCDYTCWIEVIPDGVYTLPTIAAEHLTLTKHKGFMPIENETN